MGKYKEAMAGGFSSMADAREMWACGERKREREGRPLNGTARRAGGWWPWRSRHCTPSPIFSLPRHASSDTTLFSGISRLNPVGSMAGKCEGASNPARSPFSRGSMSFVLPTPGATSSAAGPSPRLSSSLVSHCRDRSTLNLDRHSDPDGLPLAITVADAVGANGIPPWNWRDAGGNDGQNNVSHSGRVILVKWGDYTRKIGIDGSAEAIKEAIKSAFGLRTRRAFWLEDEDEVVRSLDRDMPLGTYTLHLDEGLTIKICGTEEKTLYTEEDLNVFLSRRGWTALREIDCFRTVDSLDELRPGAMYQGVRLGE